MKLLLSVAVSFSLCSCVSQAHAANVLLDDFSINSQAIQTFVQPNSSDGRNYSQSQQRSDVVSTGRQMPNGSSIYRHISLVQFSSSATYNISVTGRFRVIAGQGTNASFINTTTGVPIDTTTGNCSVTYTFDPIPVTSTSKINIGVNKDVGSMLSQLTIEFGKDRRSVNKGVFLTGNSVVSFPVGEFTQTNYGTKLAVVSSIGSFTVYGPCQNKNIKYTSISVVQ